MSRCEQFQENLTLWVLGDLAEPEAQSLALHLEACEACQKECEEIQALLQDLQEIPASNPGELFFRRQGKELAGKLQQDLHEANLTAWVLGELTGAEAVGWAASVSEDPKLMHETEEIRAIFQDLRDISLEEPAPSFFQKQSEAIQQKLLQEEGGIALEVLALGESTGPEAQEQLAASEHLQEELGVVKGLIQDLKGISIKDPGDLFFRRQLEGIRQKIRSEELPLPKDTQQRSWWNIWIRPLAVAAAIFFLVLGVSRINRQPGFPSASDWQVALEYMAEVDEPVTGMVELEELNDQQLDRLAINLERSLLYDADDDLVEGNPDWNDLNEGELDFLIKRMEAKAQT